MNLFENPKFWVALIGLIAMIVASYVPGFKLDEQAAAGSIIIMVTYLYGVIRDPGGSAWADMFKSRKFWAAAVSEVAVWLSAFGIVLPWSLTWDMVVELVTGISASLILAFTHIKTMPPAPAPDPVSQE